jgi:hypothetical protein
MALHSVKILTAEKTGDHVASGLYERFDTHNRLLVRCAGDRQA